MYFFEQAYANGGDEGVKTFEKELNLLTWSVRGNRVWEVQTRSPLIPPEDTRMLVALRLIALNCDDDLFAKSILGLAQNPSLIARLNQIRVDYEEIMRAYRREVDVTFTTKEAISPEHLEFFKKTIKLNFLQPEDNMIFNHSVDPSIKKGYTVTIGTNTFDITWDKAIALEQERVREERLKKEAALAAIRTRPFEFNLRQALKNTPPEYAEFIPQDAFVKVLDQYAI